MSTETVLVVLSSKYPIKMDINNEDGKMMEDYGGPRVMNVLQRSNKFGLRVIIIKFLHNLLCTEF